MKVSQFDLRKFHLCKDVLYENPEAKYIQYFNSFIDFL